MPESCGAATPPAPASPLITDPEPDSANPASPVELTLPSHGIQMPGLLHTAAYHMLKSGAAYQDLGADHFTRRDRSKAIGRLVRRPNDLGCIVQITLAAV